VSSPMGGFNLKRPGCPFIGIDAVLLPQSTVGFAVLGFKLQIRYAVPVRFATARAGYFNNVPASGVGSNGVSINGFDGGRHGLKRRYCIGII